MTIGTVLIVHEFREGLGRGLIPISKGIFHGFLAGGNANTPSTAVIEMPDGFLQEVNVRLLRVPRRGEQ